MSDPKPTAVTPPQSAETTQPTGTQAPAPAQGGPAPTKTLTPFPKNPHVRKWGGQSVEADWVKVRDLVDKTFGIVRVSRATITAEKGPSAGKARPSFIVEMDNGYLFSVNETDSIGGQLNGMGLPPMGAGHVYTVESQKSTVSRTGDALLLREV